MDTAAPTREGKAKPAPPPEPPPSVPLPRRPAEAPTWLRVVVSVLLICLLLGTALAVFGMLSRLKEEPPRENPPSRVLRVEVFVPEAMDMDYFVTSYGAARAHREVVVSVEVAGRVTHALDLKVGRALEGASIELRDDRPTAPREASIIVQIDPQTYHERVQQVLATLEQEQASLDRLKKDKETTEQLLEQHARQMETLERDLQRRQQLLSQGAGSETELERAKLQVDQYREARIKLQSDLDLVPLRELEIRARMNAHRNDLKLAELELEKATVRAPFSGIVSEAHVEEGQYVRPGDKLVKLTDVERIEIPVPLSLSAAAAIEQLLGEGRPPEVELARREWDFITEGAQVWRGRVRRVSPVADELTRTVLVYVEVHNSEQSAPLRPGAFVYARIAADRIPAARGLLVPRDALIDGHLYVAETISNDNANPAEPHDSALPENGPANGSESISQALPDRHAVRRRVSVQEFYQTFALVRGDLQPGDWIVMTNLDIISPGVLLDVREKRSFADELRRIRVPALAPSQD